MKATKLIFTVLTGLWVLSAGAQTGARVWNDEGMTLSDGRPLCDSGDEATDGTGAGLTDGRASRRRIGSQATAPMKARGVQHVPVILVEFQDVAFSVADTEVTDAEGQVTGVVKGTDEQLRAYYDGFCNGSRDGRLYRGHGSYGSVRDYFVMMSDSVFLPEFTIIGPVRLDNGYAYYGENAYNSEGEIISKNKNISKFYQESVAKAMEQYADWGRFDNDGNGTVDMAFFVFAGLAESNYKQDPDLIWPHEHNRSMTINGQRIAGFGVTCEARPASYRTDTVTVDGKPVVATVRGDGIGVFCHELSHALGLPDFYDTEYVAFGMDAWSIMDAGEYASNGFCPCGYTAYERDFMGWQPLETLTAPCVLTIPCFADGGGGYKIVNEANPDEYYIIENRQARCWDTALCGGTRHGLQVTHVDYSASRWNGNSVNTDPDHQRMTIIAANNNYDGTNVIDTQQQWMATLAGNLYPGDTYNYNLTDESTPAAEVYEGGLLHKPLRNITENEDGTVTVCFRTNGILDAPEVGEAENVGTEGFDAVWGGVEHATRYVCELYRDTVLLSRDTLTATTRRYDGLAASSRLRYRVRAMADSPEDWLESDWSDFSSLETLADLIPSVTDGSGSADEAPLCDLTGRRIGRPRPGIYVRHGRKVLVR